MSLALVVRLGLLISIALVSFSLGARASRQNALYLLRRPGDLLRALCAMFVIVPAFAILLAGVAPIPPAIKFAIVAMSVGPVPPVLPYKQMKAGGDESYVVGLLVAASLAALVLTPLLVELAGQLLDTEAAISLRKVATTLLISTGLPLALGMVFRAVSERAADAVHDIARRAGNVLLLVVFVAMVAAAWQDIAGLLFSGGGLAIAATVVVGLLAGHLLGRGDQKGALGLAAASRHPGVALAIAQLSFPDEIKPLTAAILLFLIISLVVTAPYVRWAGAHAKGAATVPGPSA